MQRAIKAKRGSRKGPTSRGLQGRRRGDNQMISHPPQLPSYGITKDARIRFATNAAVETAISYQNLLDTVLLAVSATSGFDVFDAVRINSVEAWGIAAIGTPATVSVVFNGETVGAAGDQKLHTDTSMGIEPAHVKARPDRLTQAGQYQASTANTAFTIAGPSGMVVDLSVSFRQPMQGQAVACQNALVGADTGAIFYRGLDGKSSSLTAFPVQGALSVI